MNVLKKSSAGHYTVPLETTLLAQRKVYLTDTIDLASANRLIQQLLYLESEDPEARIDIYIASPGGEVLAGLMIYDQIKAMGAKMPINLYCTGLAASMAAIILAGGEKGRRYALRHSKVMIHEPLLSGGLAGSASSIQRTAESILETKRELIQLLAADTGRSEEEVERAMAFDNYMSAEQALAFGMVDQIVDRV